MAKVRDRGEVLGFGVPAALFLPGVAYLGITNGHQFADAAEVVRAGGADRHEVVDEQRRGLAAATGLADGLHLLHQLLEPVAGQAGNTVFQLQPVLGAGGDDGA